MMPSLRHSSHKYNSSARREREKEREKLHLNWSDLRSKSICHTYPAIAIAIACYLVSNSHKMIVFTTFISSNAGLWFYLFFYLPPALDQPRSARSARCFDALPFHGVSLGLSSCAPVFPSVQPLVLRDQLQCRVWKGKVFDRTLNEKSTSGI